MNIPHRLTKPRHQAGSATIVVLALLSIMAIYVTVEFAAARHVDQNLQLIEQRQLQRLRLPQPKPAAALHDQPAHG
jgi:hypothetical protein